MKVSEFLEKHHASKPFFGKDGGLAVDRVKVYIGPFDLQVNNPDVRKRLIPYHDLHHVVSGFSNSRIGEGEVSAWELGTGCLGKPLALLYDLIGMATGLWYSPPRVYAAFLKGRRSRNFYGFDLNTLLEFEMSDIRDIADVKDKHHVGITDRILFLAYAFTAVLVCIALIPGFLLIRISGAISHK